MSFTVTATALPRRPPIRVDACRSSIIDLSFYVTAKMMLPPTIVMPPTAVSDQLAFSRMLLPTGCRHHGVSLMLLSASRPWRLTGMNASGNRLIPAIQDRTFATIPELTSATNVPTHA